MSNPTQQVFTDDELDTYHHRNIRQEDGFPEPQGRDDRNLAMIAHLSGFAGTVFPFGNILGPLAVWLAKRDDSEFVGDHALEALNFQITMTIAGIVAALLMIVLIGFVLLPVVAIVWVVLTIMASIKANEGKGYRYPFTLRLVS